MVHTARPHRVVPKSLRSHRTRRPRRVALCLLGGLALGSLAAAAQPIFDRGLPDANLNRAAGTERSNVAWSAGDGRFVGDDFVLPPAPVGMQWRIDQIRVWLVVSTGDTDNDTDFLDDPVLPLGDVIEELALFVGPEGGPIPEVARGTMTPGTALFDDPSITVTRVSYPGGGGAGENDYQGSSTLYREIHQIDWTDLNLEQEGDTVLYFGVDSVQRTASGLFVHGANRERAGSTQEGADDLFFHFDDATGTFLGTYQSDRTKPTGTAGGGGWDKSTDMNIQVFGTLVPITEIPTTGPGGLAMLALLLALGGWWLLRAGLGRMG